MAATMIPIQSITLTGSAASVTFSAIPQTYTDLVLRVSARCDEATVSTAVYITFNGDVIGANSLYSDTYLAGNGSAASSGRTSANSSANGRFSETGSSATASTFGSLETYIPNYTSTGSRPVSTSGAGESNAAAVSMSVGANLYRGTAAITSIACYPNNLGNFVAGSSFHLYGIRNTA